MKLAEFLVLARVRYAYRSRSPKLDRCQLYHDRVRSYRPLQRVSRHCMAAPEANRVPSSKVTYQPMSGGNCVAV